MGDWLDVQASNVPADGFHGSAIGRHVDWLTGSIALLLLVVLLLNFTIFLIAYSYEIASSRPSFIEHFLCISLSYIYSSIVLSHLPVHIFKSLSCFSLISLFVHRSSCVLILLPFSV